MHTNTKSIWKHPFVFKMLSWHISWCDEKHTNGEKTPERTRGMHILSWCTTDLINAHCSTTKVVGFKRGIRFSKIGSTLGIWTTYDSLAISHIESCDEHMVSHSWESQEVTWSHMMESHDGHMLTISYQVTIHTFSRCQMEESHDSNMTVKCLQRGKHAQPAWLTWRCRTTSSQRER